MQNTKNASNENASNKSRSIDGSWLYLIGAAYVFLLIGTIICGFYVIPYILFVIVFLIIAANLTKFKMFEKVSSLSTRNQMFLIFAAAVILRGIMLFQQQIIAKDIVFYVERSQHMLAGDIPYLDFAVHKPPLYVYLLYILGHLLSPGVIQFRAFFVVIDALVAVAIYTFAIQSHDKNFSLLAAGLYALCPLNIICIGLSGHYEPIVIIFVVLAFILMYKNCYLYSVIALGIGFAFKIFPIVLLPIILYKIDSWKKRILYSIVFLVPLLLSCVPLLITAPHSLYIYATWQTSWPPKKSFAWAMELFTGTDLSSAFSCLFLALIVIFFLSWYRAKDFRKKTAIIMWWLKFIVFLYVLYFCLYGSSGVIFFSDEFGLTNPLPLAMSLFILFFAIGIMIYYKVLLELLRKVEPELSENQPECDISIIATFSIILLLFSSSQHNPWYILWLLPFILTINSRKLRTILLCFVIWNIPSFGTQLLPGLAIA